MRLKIALPARLRAHLAERAAAWALRRQGEDHVPFTLQRRRIYILPTSAGVGFAVLLVVMLVAGLNYTNSLALFLTFSLSGFAVVAMYQCHRELLAATIDVVRVRPGFAGGTVEVELQVGGPAAQRATDLRASIATTEAGGGTRYATRGAVAAILLQCPAGQRGYWRLPRVRLSTTAPFGLFRAWVWLHVERGAPIYPRAAGAALACVTAGDGGRIDRNSSGLDELTGLRPFRDGDSPRQVAWKAYARGAPLLVKEYQGTTAAQPIFDYETLTGLEAEARLSQLCLWVLQAAARNDLYGLNLPQRRIAPATGDAHRARCLAALALFPGTAGPPR